MGNIKQAIVMRKDLNMRKGKIAAQAAHASMAIFFDLMVQENGWITEEGDMYEYSLVLTEAMEEWKEGIFTKICLYVNSEAELIDIFENALEAGLPVRIIEDIGLTEFGGVKTKTCLAIGPDYSDKIDQITGHLPLY